MKIFFTGGFGFIGRKLVESLSINHDLIIFTKNAAIASNYSNSSPIIVEEGSIEDKKISNSILKHNPDVVIHLAALSGLKKCQDSPLDAFTTNVFGTYNVAQACLQTNSKMIFCSSREVYGETLNDTSKENDALFPNNVYGMTKLLGEIIVKNTFTSSNSDYTILRISNVYGPDGNDTGINRIIKNAVDNKKIIINGGKQSMNFIYIDDVVDFFELVLKNEKSTRQIFNIGSFDNHTVQFFADIVKESLSDGLSFEYLEQPKIETSNFKLNLDKSKLILDFYPKTKLIDGIKKTIEYYLKSNSNDEI